MARFDYPARVRALEDLMEATGVDGVALSVGPDLPYFIGYEAMASERLTILVIRPQRTPVLIIPNLEIPRVDQGEFDIQGWGELDDPIRLAADHLQGAPHVAIGDHTWSAFLIGLQQALPSVSWSPSSRLTGRLRAVKDEDELECLRAAAAAVDRVLSRVPSELTFTGRSELELARDLARMTIDEGHQQASFTIVASGPNSASPHHEPNGRVITPGDLVVCDFGGRLDGYCSDVTRTFVVGEPSARHTEIHDVVLRSNQAGREAVRPGVTCQEVDRAAREVIVEAGYGDRFIHRTGHGIGLEVHEHPYIVEGDDTELVPGMTFSVEPGIYLRAEMGVRIEDIVACGPRGLVDLNRATRDLVIVD